MWILLSVSFSFDMTTRLNSAAQLHGLQFSHKTVIRLIVRLATGCLNVASIRACAVVMAFCYRRETVPCSVLGRSQDVVCGGGESKSPLVSLWVDRLHLPSSQRKGQKPMVEAWIAVRHQHTYEWFTCAYARSMDTERFHHKCRGCRR